MLEGVIPATFGLLMFYLESFKYINLNQLNDELGNFKYCRLDKKQSPN